LFKFTHSLSEIENFGASPFRSGGVGLCRKILKLFFYTEGKLVLIQK